MRGTTRRTLLSLIAFALAAPAAAQKSGPVVVLIGAPGSGKTTQAKKITRKYRIKAVSVPDLLKKSFGKKSKISRRLEATVASGDLVSDDEMNDLIKRRLIRGDLRSGFILDGYPRTARQAEFLDQLLKELGFPDVKVISLEVPDAVARKRMTGRGRADDKPEIIEQRLDDYRQEVKFIQDFYTGRGLFRIDGAQSEEEVFRRIERALDAAS